MDEIQERKKVDLALKEFKFYLEIKCNAFSFINFPYSSNKLTHKKPEKLNNFFPQILEGVGFMFPICKNWLKDNTVCFIRLLEQNLFIFNML